MDLKSFVKQALTDVIEAVQEAQEESGREIVFTVRDGQNIHFDVAVTAEDSKNAGGGFQLSVFNAGLNNETKNSITSRISLSLFVSSSKTEKHHIR
jgi:hypothetical protein